MRSDTARRSSRARNVGDFSAPRMTAADSLASSTRRNGGAVVSARAGVPHTASIAAAASRRRRNGRRTDRAIGGSTKWVACMTSLLIRPQGPCGSATSSWTRCCDELIGRSLSGFTIRTHGAAGGRHRCKRRSTGVLDAAGARREKSRRNLRMIAERPDAPPTGASTTVYGRRGYGTFLWFAMARRVSLRPARPPAHRCRARRTGASCARAAPDACSRRECVPARAPRAPRDRAARCARRP